MSALKHFNTGSIRQGFIIDEVSVRYRVMGLCSLKEVYLHMSLFNSSLLWPNFIKILQILKALKGMVPFNILNIPEIPFQNNGTVFIKKCIFHTLCNNLSFLEVKSNFNTM